MPSSPRRTRLKGIALVLLASALWGASGSLTKILRVHGFAITDILTLRERLFKLGARVQVSARRIVLHLPSAFPWLALWQSVALALGASPG